MGHLPRGPLAILKESWCGDEHLPVSFGKNASDYSVVCNKIFYKVYTLLSHTPHHTKSPLSSRERDNIFIRFGATHERDGRTDGQTDTG